MAGHIVLPGDQLGDRLTIATVGVIDAPTVAGLLRIPVILRSDSRIGEPLTWAAIEGPGRLR